MIYPKIFLQLDDWDELEPLIKEVEEQEEREERERNMQTDDVVGMLTWHARGMP